MFSLKPPFLGFCPRRDFCLFPPCYTWLQGLSCSSLRLWTSHPLPSSSQLFPLKKRNETRASCPFFIIFTPYTLFFWVPHVAMLPPTPPTHHPCGLPSDSWSEGKVGGGLNFLNSSHLAMFWGFFSERATVGELGRVCAWCVKDVATVGWRLSGCFLESNHQNKKSEREN